MDTGQGSEMAQKMISQQYDVLAPDGSEIRFLCQTHGASMVHCTLQPGQHTTAVTHRTVEEIWYFTRGEGEVWRQYGEKEEVLKAQPGLSLNIPLGTHFQFRNTGNEPLEFIITTMPPWPGEDEAVIVDGKW